MKRMLNKIAIVLAGLLMFTSAVFPFGYEVKAAGVIFDSEVYIPRSSVDSETNNWRGCGGVTFPDYARDHFFFSRLQVFCKDNGRLF